MEHGDADRRPGDELPPPVGTLFILLLYLMLMGGMWGAIYLILLER